MKITLTNCWIVAVGIWGLITPASVPGQSGGNEGDQAIVKREFGTASQEMEAVEKEIASTRPEQYAPIEARMIAVLEAPDATLPGKQFACQMLRTVGSSKCIPTVSKLLTEEKLSHVARQVFLGMRDPAVEAALRTALGQTQGNLRIGLINTIGDRGDRSSLTAVETLLNGDESTVRAALNAIGKIGGAQAAEVLERVKVPDALKNSRAQALLVCAASLAAAGDSGRADKLYRSLFEGDYPSPVRAGAFGAMVKAQKEQAVPLIMETLAANDALLRRAAEAAVIALPGPAATKALAQALAGLNTDRQVVLLEVLAARGEAAGLTETVNSLVAHESPALRETAITALGRLGDASSVPVLASALKDIALASKISQALVELQGSGVVEALIKQAEASDPVIRLTVLGVLAERRQVEALPVIRKSLKDDDANIRQASMKALNDLGVAQDFQELAGMILTTKEDSEQDRIARTMSAIGARMNDQATRCDAALQALAKADDPAKVRLLTVLASLGGDRALQAVRESLAGAGQVRKTALRALADWPDAAPMTDLLEVAKADSDKPSQIVALRGYVRMIGLPGSPADAKLQAYRQAMDLAGRPEEKRLVLAGLADVARVDALKMVEAYLDNADLKREAFLAYEKIAESLVRSEPAVAKEALQRVEARASDAGPRNRARRALERIK